MTKDGDCKDSTSIDGHVAEDSTFSPPPNVREDDALKTPEAADSRSTSVENCACTTDDTGKDDDDQDAKTHAHHGTNKGLIPHQKDLSGGEGSDVKNRDPVNQAVKDSQSGRGRPTGRLMSARKRGLALVTGQR